MTSKIALSRATLANAALLTTSRKELRIAAVGRHSLQVERRLRPGRTPLQSRFTQRSCIDLSNAPRSMGMDLHSGRRKAFHSSLFTLSRLAMRDTPGAQPDRLRLIGEKGLTSYVLTNSSCSGRR